MTPRQLAAEYILWCHENGDTRGELRVRLRAMLMRCGMDVDALPCLRSHNDLVDWYARAYVMAGCGHHCEDEQI